MPRSDAKLVQVWMGREQVRALSVMAAEAEMTRSDVIRLAVDIMVDLVTEKSKLEDASKGDCIIRMSEWRNRDAGEDENGEAADQDADAHVVSGGAQEGEVLLPAEPQPGLPGQGGVREDVASSGEGSDCDAEVGADADQVASEAHW